MKPSGNISEPIPWRRPHRLAAEGKIETRPFKGGVMLFLPGEAPKRPTTDEIIQIITAGNPSMAAEEFVIEGIKRLRKDPYRGSTVSSAD